MAPGARLTRFPTTGNKRPDRMGHISFFAVLTFLCTPGRRFTVPRENAFYII